MSYHLGYYLCSAFLEQSEYEKLVSDDGCDGEPVLCVQTLTDLIGLDYCSMRLLAHSKGIHFEQLIQLRSLVKELLLKDQTNNLAQSKKVLSETNVKIKSGSKLLNAILDKVFPKSIIEIVGKSASGKSQLAFSLALESALEGKKVFFVDCDLSFSKERFLQIINHQHPQLSQEEIKHLLSLIQIYPIFNLEKLIDFLHDFQTYQNSLLIIDSFTSVLFASEYIGEIKNRNQLYRKRRAIISQCCETLKYAVNQANLNVVLTRLLTNELKFNWENFLAADLTVLLESDSNASANKNILLSYKACDQNNLDISFTIEINKRGID